MSEYPNIVLVTVDSLRADACGHVDADWIRDSTGVHDLTPRLDELAADGLTFERAISPGPTTYDAMHAIFTGDRIPHAERETGLGPPRNPWDRLKHHMRARDTIPERLSQLGYETGAFTANPWTSRRFGFEQGFDHFEDFLDDDPNRGGTMDEEFRLRDALSLISSWQRSHVHRPWESFYHDALAWTHRASEPYFLWLFLMDVHVPYLPPSTFRRGTRPEIYAANLWQFLGDRNGGPLEGVVGPRLIRAYEDAVRYTDHHLGRFADELDEDTLLVVTADHGEGLGDHGLYGHGPHLYEENIRVPVVVWNGPSGVVERPFSLANLPDLLTGLATGADVMDLAERRVRACNYDPAFAIRGRNWKYIQREDSEELYEFGVGETEQSDDERLRERGRALVADWLSDLREKRRLADATRAVASAYSV